MNSQHNTLTMKSTTHPLSLIERTARDGLFRLLEQIQRGQIIVHQGDAILRFGQLDPAFPLSVTVNILDPRFYREIARAGSIGAGEAYMQGFWTCSDLTRLMRIFSLNMDVLDQMESGLARFARALFRLAHLVRRNTPRGSRENIAAHYDLGNEFFSLFLDETMMYSSAIFPRPEASLKEAQEFRLDQICRKLALSPDDHLLEIGTGWGGLAIHAARHYGCRVTTTTISQEQYKWARERVRQEGLEHLVTLRLDDYRDLQGQFDKLVSIEMIEAVGHEYLPAYLRKCSELLRPDGQMLIQAITIPDQRYESSRRSVDFIQRYIFPGAQLPSLGIINGTLARHTDLRLSEVEDITPHYAQTLRLWRERFFRNIEKIRELGYPESFIRMWEYYFCYCEGGFTERVIHDAQLLIVKPFCRTDQAHKRYKVERS